MDTIANRCKIIKKIRNNQIKSDINASTVGEKLLMDIFPAIDGFFIAYPWRAKENGHDVSFRV